jgi:transcriptional regulator with XRE-family HTH domain
MNDQQMEHLRERVKGLMAEQRMTAAGLSKASGVAENTVNDFLNGTKNTQGAKISKMLHALGVDGDRQGILALDGVPEDVRIFATVAVQRLSVLDQPHRDAALAKLYPLILEVISLP